MNQKQKETFVEIYECLNSVNEHEPHLEILGHVAKAIIANIGAWDKENPYQKDNQYILQENMKEIKKITNELYNKHYGNTTK